MPICYACNSARATSFEKLGKNNLPDQALGLCFGCTQKFVSATNNFLTSVRTAHAQRRTGDNVSDEACDFAAWMLAAAANEASTLYPQTEGEDVIEDA